MRTPESAQGTGRGRCVHDLFEEQVALADYRTAVSDGVRAWTYAQLNGCANYFSHRIRDAGARVETPVGIVVERSFENLAALVGIVKAGAVCLPLDPAWPPDRTTDVLARAGAVAVMAPVARPVPADLCSCPVIPIERECLPLSEARNPPLSTRPENAHSIVFTSGTRGRAKGIVVRIASVVSQLRHLTRLQSLGDDGRVLGHRSAALGGTTWDLLGPLLTGASVVLVPGSQPVAPETIWQSLVRHGITHATAAVSVWRAVVAIAEARVESCDHLRHVSTGGEIADAHLLTRLQRACPQATVHYLYGLSECLNVTHRNCSPLPDGGTRLSCGQPLAYAHVRVLDEALAMTPDGTPGDIYVAGEGLARGYLEESARTAQAFVPDPFGTTGSRMYRTGDIGMIANGELLVIGRSDSQLKVRGLRVVVEDIEAALQSCSGVAAAVVVVQGDDNVELNGYLVRSGGEGSPSAADVRRTVAAMLPPHMVPSRLVFLDALPLTLSGKVDRQALAACPVSAQGEADRREAPVGETEMAIAKIWEQVLGVPNIDRNHDFFSLGGDSLTGTRVIVRLRSSFNVEPTVQTLFDHPTIRELGSAIERMARPADSLLT